MADSTFSISAKELFDAATHFGHRTQRWNPLMRNYLYGERNGVHIFDLQKSAQQFEDALQFIKKASSEGKQFLIVGTKPQALQIIQDYAKKSGISFVTEKWIPGLLTNFETLSKRIKHLKQLKQEQEENNFEKYTKKEAVQKKKMIAKLEATLGGVSNMEKTPDVLIVTDAVRDKLAVKEAKRLKITVIGIADSNADPTLLDYVIPGNDDAVKSLKFFVGKIADAILAGKTPKK